MAYTKNATWVDGSTAITAAKLNNLETQYDQTIAQLSPLIAAAGAQGTLLPAGTTAGTVPAGTPVGPVYIRQ